MLLLATPLLVLLANRIHPSLREHRTRWAVMIYLVFATHVLLDSFTVYGTQLFWPIATTPVAWGTIFIIDPLYTLPLLVCVFAALLMPRTSDRGLLLNRYGLIVSTLYLSVRVAAQFLIEHRFQTDISAQ